MELLNKTEIENLRKVYAIGTKVELLEMDDKQAPPVGTLGVVLGVDDIGSILVKWENGSSLNVIYGVDRCRIVEKKQEK